MSSLLSSITEMVSPSLLGTMSDKLGEDKGSITKAVGAMAPTLLAGLLNKSGDSGAMSGIFDSISSFDTSSLDDLGGLLGNEKAEEASSGLIGSLLGDNASGLVDSVSSMAGLSSSTAGSSIMSMVGSMVMGTIAKKVAGGLNIGDLTSMLTDQKDEIAGAIPGELGSMLGFSMPGVGGLMDSFR